MSSKHLSLYFHERMVHLWPKGWRVSSIVSTLANKWRPVSLVAVCKTILIWEKTAISLGGLHCTGRPSEITSKMVVFMIHLLAEDDELYVFPVIQFKD